MQDTCEVLSRRLPSSADFSKNLLENERERRYRILAELSADFTYVYAVQPDGQVVPEWISPSVTQALGHTLTQLETQGWANQLHPDDVSAVQSHLARLLAGQEDTVNCRVFTNDNQALWLRLHARPEWSEAERRVVRIFGAAQNIAAQETLRENQERQTLLMNLEDRTRGIASPEDVLWEVMNLVGEYLRVSRCLYADISPSKEAAVIHRDYVKNVSSMAGRRLLTPYVVKIFDKMERGEIVFSSDVQTDPNCVEIRPIYAHLEIAAYVSVPLVKGGRLIATLTVHQNEPRQWTPYETSLLQSVAERTWTMMENARLFQAERERSEQLIGAIREVHHRTKNNLQAVSGLLEMQIPDEGDLISVEAVYDALGQIKTIALVHDLLARDQPMGKVDTGQVVTNLATLISSGMRTGQQRQNIQTEVEAVYIPTKAATAVALIVNELLTNALKHSSRYEKNLGENQADILLKLRRENGNVILSVQDNGPGFPPDFQPERFANIGLELVLTLVRSDLRGSITFTNMETSGGLVVVTFPEDLASD